MVTTELRQDPLTGRWTIVDAPGRGLHELLLRPQSGDAPGAAAAEGERQVPCVLCEGREADAGPELLAWREGTPANGPGWSVRVVPNPAAALGIEGQSDVRQAGPHAWRDGLGAHEVVIESPSHGEVLQALPVERLWRVLWAWRTRLGDLKRDRRFAAGLVFKNHGALAGALVGHAHSQVVASVVVPPALDERLAAGGAWADAHGRCIVCDVLATELAGGSRVVWADEDLVALAPFASRVPFQVLLAPRAHAARFEEASDALLTALAGALRRVLVAIGWAIEEPAYNLALYTAPFDGRADAFFHWHLEVLPRITRVGGFEWGSGFHRNPVAPETAAGVLRERMGL